MSESRGGAMVAWSLAVGAVVILGYAWFRPAEDTRQKTPTAKESQFANGSEDYMASAEDLFERGDYRAARKVARTAGELEPTLLKAFLIAGDASIKLNDLDAAIKYFSKVPRNSRPSSLAAQFGMARAEALLGSYAEAEGLLADIVIRQPTHAGANDLFAEVLDVEGRRWESVRYGLELARQGEASLEALLLLVDGEYVLRPNPRAADALSRDPKHLTPQLGLARAALDQGEQDRGLTLLAEVCAAMPGLIEAQLLWGEHLLDAKPEAFAQWHSQLPASADDHPKLWFLRGTWARRQKQLEPAARCFWETLRRNPDDRAAHFQLSQVLTLLDRKDDARPFQNRGLQLSQLKKILEPVVAAGDQSLPEELRDVAVGLEVLGRDIEAANWRYKADAAEGEVGPFEPIISWISDEERSAGWWVREDCNPSREVELFAYPVPVIEATKPQAGMESEDSLLDDGFAATFQDMAAEAGLRFTFIPAPDEATEGKRMIEFTGGGVGIIDFDLDNRPDLFLTQGGFVPVRPGIQPTDCLFRNMGTEFEDVATLAGVAGVEYGQGMSVGDFNSDGFPDLFVGNLGPNRLFVNNGDGTFSDASGVTGFHNDWTTSVVLADFNADSLPDLYVTNYLAGGGVDHLICRLNDDALPRVCTPDQFDASQDRVFLNLGNGEFEDRTATSGIQLPQGKGLGVLAADFFGSGRLQLFVANDGVPNFFFDVQEEDFVFTDVATSVGVSLSGDGLAQACMGVACGDANNDGQLDFFVTNFDRESNTMYLGSSGLFEDASRPAGLREPGFRMLGFGTQFIDGDLNGDSDLIVANGHIDDYSHQGTAYRMRPQYFRNNGAGDFAEIEARKAGSFFNKEQLGRSLCTVDWNRDGRPDFVVSHLDTPVALVTNASPSTGHFLRVKAVGTTANRDGVGTILKATNGDWNRTRHVVAGDGYQCSNERVVTFGLGDATVISQLDVTWLDGSTQTFRNVAADQEVLIVQGRSSYLGNVD